MDHIELIKRQKGDTWDYSVAGCGESLTLRMREDGYVVLRLPEEDAAHLQALYDNFAQFTSCDEAVKASVAADEGQKADHLSRGDLGYRSAMGRARSSPDEFLDLREQPVPGGWEVGPCSPQVHRAVPGLERAATGVITVLSRLGASVMALLASSFGLDGDAFTSVVLQDGHMPGACLRMCCYSPSQHTDEVRARGEWVCPEAGATICDVVAFPGEFLEILTKGFLRAALHRVVRPSVDARYSIPFLIRAKPNAIVNTRPYIEEGNRLRDSQNAKKKVPGPRNILDCENKTMQWLWNYANGW